MRHSRATLSTTTFAATNPHPPIEQLTITTFAGLEEVLAAELRELGARNVVIGRRAVSCRGDRTLLYRANLELRTGIKVLRELARFRVRSEQALYDRLRRIDWSPWIAVDGHLWVDTTTQSKQLRNPVYLSQLTKDAIVDQFRERTGERPGVRKEQPDLVIQLHIGRDQTATVSLNASGDSLHRRGYRGRTGEAPLNEVLAAGLLLLAGYDGEVPFVDPMCGSGTIPVEAALIAGRRAPGINRNFGFERWPDFDGGLWQQLKRTAREQERKPPHPIVAADRDAAAVRIAGKTAERAGVVDALSVLNHSFEDLPAPPALADREGGMIVTNPPYEMRLRTGDIAALYSMIGDTLKQQWQGYTAWILSGSPAGVKAIGLRSSKRIILMNGPVEVRLVRYDLYAGSRKGKD